MNARLSRGLYGERLAKSRLRRHMHQVRALPKNHPFDFIGIDRLTGQRLAIEVKTIGRRTNSHCLVHIEADSLARKQDYLAQSNRQGIVMLVFSQTRLCYATALSAHIYSRNLMRL